MIDFSDDWGYGDTCDSEADDVTVVIVYMMILTKILVEIVFSDNRGYYNNNNNKLFTPRFYVCPPEITKKLIWLGGHIIMFVMVKKMMIDVSISDNTV